jgi:DNA-binding SARP family transcriptional activator
LEVVRDGATVDVGGPKQRTLLAVLLLHANTVLPRARLIEALWGESAPPTAQASLRNLVSHLRRVLGGERVESTAAGYAVRVGADELDASRFERLVEEVDSQPARERVARLREGLDLWRGPPLPDCALDHDELAELGRLEELRLTALEAWLEARIELGDTDAVVSELQPLVVRHPLRERLWYQLMLSLYRPGGRRRHSRLTAARTRRSPKSSASTPGRR